MFDLGFRQVIINDGSDVKEESIGGKNYINIVGFGKFEVGGSSLNEFKDPIDSTFGLTNITIPTGWNIDQVWEIKVFIEGGEGSGGAGNIRESGQTVYFQVAKIKGSAATSFNDLLKLSVDTFKEDPTTSGDPNTYLTFSAGAFSFEPGYEGFTVTKVLATKIYDPAIQEFDDRESVAEDITGAILEGIFGFGYPSQLEEAIRNNTTSTLNPYGIHVGGNVTIDFSKEARYTEVTFFTSLDHYDGTKPHDIFGYGDANTQTNYKDRKYSVYIKSADSSGSINTIQIAVLKTI